MRYYRRYFANGTCVIICTRCFATVGTASGFAVASELEGQHVCGPRVTPSIRSAVLETHAMFREPEKGSDRLVRFLRGLNGKYVGLLFVVISLLVYGLPNMVEFVAAGHLSPWVVNILFGDLIGCLCLVLLRMPRTGIILYMALALLEGWLLAAGRVSPGTLAWITDAVPTLVVAGRVAQLRAGTALTAKTA